MAHLDSRTGEIVVHIVYDGLPGAGKTTNVRALHGSLLTSRAGEVLSPETSGRATVFFDWRDFMGGYVDGRLLRCRVLSVPGQHAFRRRRLLVLDAADAVVFVTEAAEAHVAANQRLLAAWRLLNARRPVPLVLQVNKLDLPYAPEPRALAEKLGLASVPIVGANANEGRGVTETFLVASRLARERLDAVLEAGGLEADAGPLSAEELEREMRALERD